MGDDLNCAEKARNQKLLTNIGVFLGIARAGLFFLLSQLVMDVGGTIFHLPAPSFLTGGAKRLVFVKLGTRKPWSGEYPGSRSGAFSGSAAGLFGGDRLFSSLMSSFSTFRGLFSPMILGSWKGNDLHIVGY